MATPLEFGTSVLGERRILAVKGELDMSTSPIFEQALLGAVAAPGGEVVLELSGVRFIDVTALRTLLRAADAAQAAHVPLRLAASPAIDRVFELLGIETAPAAPCPDWIPASPCSWMELPPGAGMLLPQERCSAHGAP